MKKKVLLFSLDILLNEPYFQLSSSHDFLLFDNLNNLYLYSSSMIGLYKYNDVNNKFEYVFGYDRNKDYRSYYNGIEVINGIQCKVDGRGKFITSTGITVDLGSNGYNNLAIYDNKIYSLDYSRGSIINIDYENKKITNVLNILLEDRIHENTCLLATKNKLYYREGYYSNDMYMINKDGSKTKIAVPDNFMYDVKKICTTNDCIYKSGTDILFNPKTLALTRLDNLNDFFTIENLKIIGITKLNKLKLLVTTGLQSSADAIETKSFLLNTDTQVYESV